jgi:acetyl esterase
LIVRVHEPKNSPIPTCALLYFHGGSGVAGDVLASSGLAMRYAFESQCFVYSVEYRLAPEFRNPIPIMDAYASVKWLVDRARTFGVDSNRIAYFGDQGGASIAAAVGMILADRGESDLVKFQLL